MTVAMVMCMASKISKACDISQKVRKEVLERDNHQCIICGANHGLNESRRSGSRHPTIRVAGRTYGAACARVAQLRLRGSDP